MDGWTILRGGAPLLLSIALLTSCAEDEQGPDLSLQAEPAVGMASPDDCYQPRYFTIVNHGTEAAYAVVLIRSIAGRRTQVHQRIYPGPEAGASMGAWVCPPKPESADWCLEAQLQRLSDQNLSDPNPGNNRWCTEAGKSPG